MIALRASAHATATRERLAAILIATLLVVFRAYVFIAWEQSHFDADQAIVGLMAKHLLEGRAFPLYFYGQQYLLGIEPLLVAPAFALGGISVATLKIPLLIANIVVAAGLILALERWAGVRPLAGLVAALFFILPPPGTASRLVQANGCNIEPFLYVLALWWLRDRPLGLGLVAGVGMLNREFTAYGVAALALTELARGRLVSLDGLRRWTITVVAILSVMQLVNALVPARLCVRPRHVVCRGTCRRPCHRGGTTVLLERRPGPGSSSRTGHHAGAGNVRRTATTRAEHRHRVRAHVPGR